MQDAYQKAKENVSDKHAKIQSCLESHPKIEEKIAQDSVSEIRGMEQLTVNTPTHKERRKIRKYHIEARGHNAQKKKEIRKEIREYNIEARRHNVEAIRHNAQERREISEYNIEAKRHNTKRHDMRLYSDKYFSDGYWRVWPAAR